MSTSIYNLLSRKLISFQQAYGISTSLSREFPDAIYCCVIRIAPPSNLLDESRWYEYDSGVFSYTVNNGFQNNHQFKEFLKDCLEDNQFETIDVKYKFATIIQIEVESDIESNSRKLAAFCRNRIIN